MTATPHVPAPLPTTRAVRVRASLACALAVVAAGVVLVPGALDTTLARWNSDDGVSVVVTPALLVSVVAGLAGFAWVCAVDARAAVVAPGHRARSVLLGVLGWSLPVVSIVYPPVTLSRIGAASGLGRGWQWLLAAWFLTWFALPGSEGNAVAPPALGPSLSHVYGVPAVLLVSLVLKVAAWTAVVLTVTRAQERRLR